MHSRRGAVMKNQAFPDWRGSVVWALSESFTKGKVIGSIPGQAHAWIAGLVPSLGACWRQLIDVSLSYKCFSPSLFPSLPLSTKKKINTPKEKNKTKNKFSHCLSLFSFSASHHLPFLLSQHRLDFVLITLSRKSNLLSVFWTHSVFDRWNPSVYIMWQMVSWDLSSWYYVI